MNRLVSFVSQCQLNYLYNLSSQWNEMSRKREGLTPVLQSPIMSLKTGPRPMTCADNLMLSWWLLSVVAVVIGLELVCSALTKARAVFSLNKNRSCWNERCINVPCSRSLWVCSTKSFVFLGIFNLSVTWKTKQIHLEPKLQVYQLKVNIVWNIFIYTAMPKVYLLPFKMSINQILGTKRPLGQVQLTPLYWPFNNSKMVWIVSPTEYNFGYKNLLVYEQTLQSTTRLGRIKGPRNWLLR